MASLSCATGCSGSNGPTPKREYRPNALLDIPAEGEIADPHVIKVGTTYYLYATNAPSELRAWSSEDLVHWRAEGAVWQPVPGSWADGQKVWAPHVEAAPDGSYYLYISANLRIGVSRSDSPLGPFVDVLDHPLVGAGYGHVGDGVTGQQPLDWDENAIDAFVLRDDLENLTLFFAAYDPLSKIYLIPMLDYTTLADVPPQLVIGPDQAWEGAIVEGTWIEQHAGRYYLMYSGNVYLTASYAIGVAVSDAPLGPYDKYVENPILATDEAAELYGPGHNSVVAGFGDERVMFYHAKSSAAPGADRRLRTTLVEFDADHRLEVPAP